ncbi:MAG: exodeoxyribonuclease V subunit gamma [Propionicimonas sp.]|uniref:exodeoxyribonuclease V subunit gamma n=1 Tax=Propionicimonas sp. TaxID=1955623 RepID=UPI003D121FFB
MQFHHARTADQLARTLVGLWSGPRSDPFEFDLAVVPGAGFQRWLSQRIATAGERPGICAGIEITTTGGLWRRVDAADDPWRPGRLAWAVLRLAGASTDPELEVLQRHIAASREGYTTARRIAAQFAGYADHRPAMLGAWLDGDDSGPDGCPLAENAWQAHLWRELVAHLGSDPLTRRAELLDRLRTSPVAGLPRRVAVLAPERVHEGYLALLAALGDHHQVDVLLLTPAPSRRPVPAPAGLRRSEFTAPPGHPLNRSLGVVSDEAALLLPPADDLPDVASPDSLLGWLQADLRADREGGPRTLRPGDGSVQVHLSHGDDRQVEVLREVLTSVLAADPSLEPRDIVVLTPAIEPIAPLVTAAFTAPPQGAVHPAQGFRVQLADRTLTQVNPMVTLLLELLRLPDGRAEASTLLEFCAHPAVAQRFGFTAESRARLVELVERAGIRWGLSGAQRTAFGLGSFPQNTWFAGLQRMLLGVAIGESDLVSAGTVLPLDDIESSDVELIGGLTELVGRLSRLFTEVSTPTTIAGWTLRCRDALSGLVALPPTQEWQLSDLWAGLTRLADRGAAADDHPVDRHTAVRAIEHEFETSPARGAFGNGSLVVAGPTSLRHVPHRVVVLLGWDADRYPRSPRRHGDDLLALDPCVGEPSAALLDRQLLLDAVHAAGQTLVVVARGRSEATNEDVPLAAPVAELVEALDRLASTPDGTPAGAAVTHRHPLQPFDPAYFDGERPDLTSVDALAFRAATALLADKVAARPRYRIDPLPEPDLGLGVSLDDLVAWFGHPARTLLRQSAGVSLGDDPEPSDAIPIEPDGLARWQIGNRMLAGLRQGRDPAAVERAEWLRGEVPPFQLGTLLLAGVRQEAQRSAQAVSSDLPAPALHDLAMAVPVPDRGTTTLIGRVTTHGTEIVQAEFSSLQPRHRLAAWVRLLALAAAEPGPWRARVAGKGRVCVLAAPPQAEARRLLGDLIAIRSIGLSRPLPALPRLCAEWATLRQAGQDPLEPRTRNRLRDRWDWEAAKDPSYTAFFDFPGVLDLPVGDLELPGADEGEPNLVGALARAIWTPLLDSEVAP